MSDAKVTPSIKIETNKVVHKFPRLSLFIGKPKIGKSTVMSKLKDALVLAIDTEGYDDIEVKALNKPKTLSELFTAIKWFFSAENTTYKILVIDHLRSISQLFDNSVKTKEEVKYTVDVPFGRGAAYIKDDLFMLISGLRARLAENPDKYVFIVAHADDRNSEIRLDVNGKNENMILGMVDSIGYIGRDPDNTTTINFNIRGGVEFGSRNKFLASYSGKLDWDYLFKLAQGEIKS